MRPDLAPAAGTLRSNETKCAADSRFLLADDERWYVANTLPHQEDRAETQLLQQGFRPFLPRMIKTVRHARKLRNVKAPVFPGYIFIAFDSVRDRWHSINGTWGIRRLMTANDKPIPVPRGVTEAFVESCGADHIMRFDGGLSAGQSVRVIQGPFVDLIGRIERIDAKGRVKILLEIMGGEIAATFPRTALRVA